MLKPDAKVIPHDPVKRLLDKRFIAEVILECMQNNDFEGIIEIIETHLEIVNKVKAMQKNSLPKSTMYNALKSKNPTLKTLSKMVNCLKLEDN